MSRQLSDDDINLRAGEYVLGVLSREEIDQFRRDLLRDTALRDAVIRWEHDFAPLALALDPVVPPPHLRDRIETTLDLWSVVQPSQSDTVVLLPPKFVRRERRWQLAAGAALALAASLAAVLLVGRVPLLHMPEPGPLVAAIAATSGIAPQWIASTRSDGKLVVVALGSVTRPANRDLELWALARGATRPIPLGVLPRTGALTASLTGIPLDQLRLLVSVEPLGGSRTGLPTGPVISGGALQRTD